MRRDPGAQKVARPRRERWTRAAGRFYGTQATAYGSVGVVTLPRDMGRIGLALVLLVGLASMLLFVLGQAEVVLGQVEVAPWLHMVLHAVGLSHGGPLSAHLR